MKFRIAPANAASARERARRISAVAGMARSLSGARSPCRGALAAHGCGRYRRATRNRSGHGHGARAHVFHHQARRHRERPFFSGLVAFMTSGPVVVQVLEGENAVTKYREVMGATDPAKAAAGTIRKDFAESIEANSVHGSDSLENAAKEVAFFFKPNEIVG